MALGTENTYYDAAWTNNYSKFTTTKPPVEELKEDNKETTKEPEKEDKNRENNNFAVITRSSHIHPLYSAPARSSSPHKLTQIKQ